MTTVGLVAPEQREIVASIKLFDPGPDAVTTFRANLVEGANALVSSTPTNVEVMTIPASGGRPDLRILIHRPTIATGQEPAIISLHGGGLIAGTPDMMSGANDRIARETASVVFAPDYRLAPESPLPAALEDAYATLLWLNDHASELGIDRARISVMGDSAGGYLAASLALLVRDQGTPPLRAQFLIYPMLDHRTDTPEAPSNDPLTGEFVWTRSQNRFAFQIANGKLASKDGNLGSADIQSDFPPAWRVGLQFLSKDDARTDDATPYFRSPAVAADLKRLPPTFIMVGALDLYRDEAIAYAQRLAGAGVPTDLIVYAGAVHAFDWLPGELGNRARDDLASAIRRLA